MKLILFPTRLKYSILIFILLFFQSISLFSFFKYVNYKNGEMELFKSNIGNIKILYIITDTTLEQKVKILNLTISNFYTYDDTTIYHKSKYVKFFSFKENLVDKNRSIKFKFPLKDSMSWEGKGIAERNGREIPYQYKTFVKDTTITSGKGKIKCYKISSRTILSDGEHSLSIYYFSPFTKKFVRVEKTVDTKGLFGKALHFLRVNKIILYK